MDDAIREARALAEDDSTWNNPLEQILSEYYQTVATPYWEGRNVIFDLLEVADTKEARSAVFDSVREYDNNHFGDRHFITSPSSGARILVPNEIVRTWNGRPQKEREERLVEIVGKKPEWLNQFEIAMMIEINPESEQYFPSTPEETEVYSDIAEQKRMVIELARDNPTDITQSRRDKVLGELDDQLLAYLLDNGRGGEAVFREAVPLQKASLAGLLAPSLDGILPLLNQVIAELRVNEESPTTEAGRRAFLALQTYLELDYFVNNPQAEIDFDELGIVMFDEPLRAAAYAKLLQGDFLGQLD
jgi:hypothetical protein